MTYGFYCYKPISDRPSTEEARRILYAGDGYPPLKRPLDPEVRSKIASGLITFDPKLERSDYGPREFDARIRKVTVPAHIGLDSPGGALAIQITIFDDHASLTIPFWYTGSKAQKVFARAHEYMRVIRETAGFFAYDPQNEIAYDPLETESDWAVYETTTKRLPGIIDDIRKGRNPTKKPASDA